MRTATLLTAVSCLLVSLLAPGCWLMGGPEGEDLRGERDCNDDRDNDHDGLADCDDPDCADEPPCDDPLADLQPCDAAEQTGAPPRIMLLVDVSGSMDEPLDPDDEDSKIKWDVATAAIERLVDKWSDLIDFGLDIFPNSGNCEVGAPVRRDVAGGTSSEVVTAALPMAPYGHSTPMYCALDNFADPDYAPGFSAAGSPRFIVLLSDGADLCGTSCSIFGDATSSDFQALAQRLAAQGITVMPVGFSREAHSEQLKALARGSKSFFGSYLDAEDEQQLDEALELIAQAAAGCSR